MNHGGYPGFFIHSSPLVPVTWELESDDSGASRNPGSLTNELGPGLRRDDASVLISTLVPRSDSERLSAASGYFYPVIPAKAGIQEF
jgi:hypothetical protein